MAADRLTVGATLLTVTVALSEPMLFTDPLSSAVTLTVLDPGPSRNLQSKLFAAKVSK